MWARMAAITRELAEELGQTVKIARLYSSQPRQRVNRLATGQEVVNNEHPVTSSKTGNILVRQWRCKHDGI